MKSKTCRFPDPPSRLTGAIRWRPFCWRVLCAAALALVPCGGLRGEAPGSSRISVIVNGQPIPWEEVLHHRARLAEQRDVAPAVDELIMAQALRVLIDRELLLGRLQREGQAASDADVELALQRWQSQIEGRGSSREAGLAQLGLNEAGLRKQLRWQLSWSRFLQRHLTDENLDRYFQNHRRDFDGTELRLAQILLPVEPAGDEAAVAAAVGRARELRAELLAKKVTFADAARRHSSAPSGEEGGDIGWIARREPLPESISRAAFALQVGEISEPVVSRFGVHLLLCREVRPGEKTWQEVREQLVPEVAEYLLGWYAGKERSRARLEWRDTPPAVRTLVEQLWQRDS